MKFLLVILLLAMTGCATRPPVTTGQPRPSGAPAIQSGEPAPRHGGGYYLDDGPGDNPPPDIASIPDAVPRVEPLRTAANKPYEALGQYYVPMTTLAPYHETGIASWYGRRFDGQSTSSGETYHMYAMTAAHRTLPIPSYARVTALDTGRSVIVRINDRGPFRSNRIIDLSYTAAYKLGLVQHGSGKVEVEAITPDQIAKGKDVPPRTRGTFLQLASFSDHDNAARFLADTSTRLSNDVAALAILNQDGHFRVVLGPYDDQDSLDQAAAEVRLRMNLDPIRLVSH